MSLLNSNVAGAWQLYSTKGKKRRVATPLDKQEHSHSYRHEMETYYHALKDATEQLKHPHKIHQYMDCKAA